MSNPCRSLNKQIRLPGVKDLGPLLLVHWKERPPLVLERRCLQGTGSRFTFAVYLPLLRLDFPISATEKSQL